ncbi:MAG TPA: PAS domain-containing protein [Nannocystaceae bacterium]|nr:PAS domain-containing protein [Nannocystaceae bacterium]
MFGWVLGRSRGGAIVFAALLLLALLALALRSSAALPFAPVIASAATVLAGALAISWWVVARRSTARVEPGTAQELETLRHAIAIAGIGEWRWDLRTQKIAYGRGCASMLGYPDGDVDSTLSAWGKLAHPDDLPRVRALVDDLVEGRIDHYEQRVRLRAADGSWRTIVDRGRVVARDPAGRPMLAIGVHVDPAGMVAPVQGLRGTCLVIDDDATVRTIVETAARRLGLPVLGFADAESAWRAMLDGGAPRAIVTDFDMPGMNGLQLAECVRAAGFSVPVVLMSGRLPADATCCDAIVAVLGKPFTVTELTSAIATATQPQDDVASEPA